MPTTHAINAQVQQNQAMPIREYISVIRKRFWLFVLCFMIISALGIIYTLKQPRIYQATTAVIINPEPPTINAIDNYDTQQWYLRDTYYDTQLKVMHSRNVAQRVVDDLALASNLEFLGFDKIKQSDVLQKMLEDVDPVSHLLGMITIESVPATRLVYIKVRHQRPEIAARLADAVADAYSEQNSEHRLTSLNNTFDFIKEQYADYETRLTNASNALNAFKNEHQILYSNPLEQQKLTNQLLESLLNRRVEIETQKLQAGYVVAELEKLSPELHNVRSYEILADTQTLSSLYAQYLDLQQEERKLLVTYLENSSQVQSVREKMELSREAIATSLSAIKKGYEAKYNSLVKLDTDILKQIKALKTEALQLDQLKLLYEQVENQKAEQERLFESSQKKLNEVSLNRLLDINNIRILDKAVAPKSPISPRIFVNVVITLLAALLAAFALIFVLELLDLSIKNQSDIELKAGLPFLGVVPSIPKSGREKKSTNPYRFVIDNPKSPLSECVRTLRTTLSFMLPPDKSQVLLITSPSPLEGKTTTALNLAVTYALTKHRVLLIEADLRRPKLYKALGLPKAQGLTAVLNKEATLEQVITKTTVEHLDLLPCGEIPSNPSEIFQSDFFTTLLNTLKNQYDYIIIDSPPVTAVTDALIMAQYSDGVIIVTKAGKTQLPLLIRARELLQGVNAPILGVVLNALSANSSSYSGYYYYYTREYSED
ncbi:MAG: GumC family protein [Bradymonadia bacterium]|jgi:succinoglycan biosynthesis transport protein ExoP